MPRRQRDAAGAGSNDSTLVGVARTGVHQAGVWAKLWLASRAVALGFRPVLDTPARTIGEATKESGFAVAGALRDIGHDLRV